MPSPRTYLHHYSHFIIRVWRIFLFEIVFFGLNISLTLWTKNKKIINLELWQMGDLKRSEKILQKRNLNLAIVKNKKLIYSSKKSGLKSLVTAGEVLGKKLRKSALSDRIIGKAAALISARFHVNSVFGKKISKKGIETLQNHDIEYEYEEKIPAVVNEEGKPCPFEKTLEDIEKPRKAYEKVKKDIF